MSAIEELAWLKEIQGLKDSLAKAKKRAIAANTRADSTERELKRLQVELVKEYNKLNTLLNSITHGLNSMGATIIWKSNER